MAGSVEEVRREAASHLQLEKLALSDSGDDAGSTGTGASGDDRRLKYSLSVSSRVPDLTDIIRDATPVHMRQPSTSQPEIKDRLEIELEEQERLRAESGRSATPPRARPGH